MTKIENKICDFIQKNIIAIGFAALSILGLVLRIAMKDAVTADYSFFMKSWIAQLLQYDGLSGIGQNIGEYNVPYMLFLAIVARTPFNDLYEIKALSILFDYAGAFIAVKLISLVCKTKFFTKNNLIAYAVILFNPVFFLDSAFWAQCDFIYTALCLLCLYLLVKEKHNAAMIVYGLAIAVKLQAIFFLPVIVIYYFVSRRMKIASFLWIPAVFIVSALPAILAGRGVVDTLTVYLNQTSIYESLTMNCPNLYVFIRGDYEIFKSVGIWLTLAVLGVGACLFIRRGSISPEKTLLLAAWCAMVCIYFLPSMHERYPFMVCAFSIVWAFVCHKDWWVALGINLVCLLSYVPYLFKTTVVSMEYLSLANLVFLAFLSYRLFSEKGREPNEMKESIAGR